MPTLASITFDCADALAVARFWGAVFDRPLPDDASADFAHLAGEPALSFYKVPEKKKTKNRVHVDLGVNDLEAEVTRLVKLGASRLADFNENGYRWTTLTDPEGNEFDVVLEA